MGLPRAFHHPLIFTSQVNGLLIFPYGGLLILRVADRACNRCATLTLPAFYENVAAAGRDVSGIAGLFALRMPRRYAIASVQLHRGTIIASRDAAQRFSSIATQGYHHAEPTVLPPPVPASSRRGAGHRI